MEFGLYTFADLPMDGLTGQAANTNQRIKNLLEEIKLADQAGLDVFGVGEHHRPDYAVSSPTLILAAAAVLTKHIKLSSAVTVLSSEDPVRVFQQFSTVDQLSNGRAEIMVGRGSFTESFPLFGYNLRDYDELFEEKLNMLLQLNDAETISWNGKFTQTITKAGIYPRPFQNNLPIWQAVGGTPESAIRAGKLGLPLALAIIGGMPEQFVSFINLYKDTWHKYQPKENKFQLGINSHVYVAETSQKAADEFFPSYVEVMSRIGKERGWQPMSREQFDYSRTPKGSLMVGSPEQVTEKILYEYELFGNTRFLAQMSLGNMQHEKVMKSIELYATKVVPTVKAALKTKSS